MVERDARPDAGRARARQAARAASATTGSLWGTDSIWYGTPQDQIQAFRTFQITAEFQDSYGYPALTDASEAQDLRAERGRLYGAEPVDARRATPTPAALEEYRAALPHRTCPTAPATAEAAVAASTAAITPGAGRTAPEAPRRR